MYYCVPFPLYVIIFLVEFDAIFAIVVLTLEESGFECWQYKELDFWGNLIWQFHKILRGHESGDCLNFLLTLNSAF